MDNIHCPPLRGTGQTGLRMPPAQWTLSKQEPEGIRAGTGQLVGPLV